MIQTSNLIRRSLFSLNQSTSEWRNCSVSAHEKFEAAPKPKFSAELGRKNGWTFPLKFKLIHTDAELFMSLIKRILFG